MRLNPHVSKSDESNGTWKLMIDDVMRLDYSYLSKPKFCVCISEVVTPRSMAEPRLPTETENPKRSLVSESISNRTLCKHL